MGYRRLWQWFWSLVMALGVGLAFLEWSPFAVLFCLGLLVVLGSSLKTLAGRVPVQALPASLTMALAVIAVWAIGAVSPALGLLTIMTAGLTAPNVVDCVRRCRRRSGNTSVGTEPSPRSITIDVVLDECTELSFDQPLCPLEGLDDSQLCRMWRESFWDLDNRVPAQSLLGIVLVREACLDELERRDAAALRAWLDSGARASGGPEKFMSRKGRGGTEAA
jgi:hypothetical protein